MNAVLLLSLLVSLLAMLAMGQEQGEEGGLARLARETGSRGGGNMAKRTGTGRGGEGVARRKNKSSGERTGEAKEKAKVKSSRRTVGKKGKGRGKGQGKGNGRGRNIPGKGNGKGKGRGRNMLRKGKGYSKGKGKGKGRGRNMLGKGKGKGKGSKIKVSSPVKQSNCTVSESCAANIVSYMKLLKDAVGNYIRQEKRIARNLRLGTSKNDKKDIFSGTKNRIVEIGGGNSSNLTCSGSSTSSGALQLKNITAVLNNCSVAINTDCNNTSFPMPNMTNVRMHCC